MQAMALARRRLAIMVPVNALSPSAPAARKLTSNIRPAAEQVAVGARKKAMRKRTRCIGAATILAVLAPAMTTALRAETPPCPAGTQRFTEYRLFFGRSRGAAEVVNDAAWSAFLADEITPRFPGGLTVLDAAGQWRDGSGTLVKERTKLVIILARPDDPEDGMRRTDEIAQAYKRAFGQEAVLRTVGTACASFQQPVGLGRGCLAPKSDRLRGFRVGRPDRLAAARASRAVGNGHIVCRHIPLDELAQMHPLVRHAGPR